MRLSKRHTEQAPAVSTPFGSLRYHRISGVGSGQNYPAGFISFTAGTAGGGQSGTPVGVKTPSHRPSGSHVWDSLMDEAGRLFCTQPTTHIGERMPKELTDNELNGLRTACSALRALSDNIKNPTPETEEAITTALNECKNAIAAIEDERKPTIFIADPDCPICHGTGIRCIPNGPDDYDREVCDCQPEEEV